MIDTKFLDQFNKFSLLVKKRVTSNYIGPRRSIAQGRGILFKEHRVYAPGDDFRAIDWKIFARTDDLMIKTYEEERNLTAHILLDYSGSMGFGAPMSKFDYAAMVGVGFAYLAIKDNEKFMFSTFSDTLEVFQAKRGMSQLAAMVHHLNSIKTTGSSKLSDSLKQYKRFLSGRAMVILISDFLLDIEEIREALYTLGKNEVKVIQVLDPVEKNLTMEGDFKLKDSETGFQLRTYIGQRLRHKYQDQLDDHCAKVEEVCNKLGIDYHLIVTDKPIFDAFYEILE